VGILVPKTPRLAATLVGIMIFLWVLLQIPRAMADPRPKARWRESSRPWRWAAPPHRARSRPHTSWLFPWMPRTSSGRLSPW